MTLSSAARTAVCLVLAGIAADHGIGTASVVAEAQNASGEAVRRLLDVGDYAEAERLATEWRNANLRETETDSLQTAQASDYLVEALIKNGKGGATATLDIAARLVSVKERWTGPDSIEVAVSLDNLGRLRSDRGEFAEAVPLHQRALAIRTRTAASDTAALADTLDALAVPLIRLDRIAEADQLLQDSVRLRETGSVTSRDLARTLALQALLHRYDGNYAAAVAPLERALEIFHQFSPNHPDVITALETQGDLRFLTGDVAAARQAWSESLTLAERRLQPQHPLIAILLHNLSWAAAVTGDVTRSQDLIHRATEIGRQSFAPCHPEVPGLLNDSAGTAKYQGNFTDAQRLYADSLAVIVRCLGPNHSLTATILHNQGTLAIEMGDLNLAERLHRRTVRIWSVALGANHPYVARGLDALAGVVAQQGDRRRALQLYERALSIRKRALGPTHPDVASTLVNIARVALASGNPSSASTRVNEALAIYQEGGFPQEPDHLARALQLRGDIETRRGAYRTARETYQDAVTTREHIFGSSHPLTAQSAVEVARASFELGLLDEATQDALNAEQIGRDHLRFTIRYLPERQAMAYAAARPRGLDLALSIAAVNQSREPSRLFDAVIRSRGVILDELAARARSTSASPDQQLASLNAGLVSARQRFAALMLRSLQGEESVPTPLLDEARQQKEDAERALAGRSAAAREEAQHAQTGLDDVRRAMSSGSALVSFVRYDRTTVINRSSGHAVTTTPSYIALVTRADSDDVRVIPLGTAAPIERLIEAWRTEAGGRAFAAAVAPGDVERRYRNAASALRARIWDPLASSLAGARRVFVVPDGALNLVSFAALPVGNRYLLESGPTIHYLSTERDLVRGEDSKGRGLLALGGPTFGAQAPAAAESLRRSGCGTIGSLRFEDLPGSRAEVQDIARLWGAADVVVLNGRAATKAALTKAIVGRKVIHLATHGFFLGSDCEPAIPRTRGVGGIVGAAAAAPVDNPLLMSGLALAGVNTLSGARQSNGILNAEEIAGLNLQGTEWVVLSACDTGLGQITAGEGVFGLRRALQIAGVHTIIMSLWSVEDQSTRDWMKALYTARLAQQLDTPDAVRAASVQVLEQRRKRNLSTHPFYWAAFVAAGDWR